MVQDWAKATPRRAKAVAVAAWRLMRRHPAAVVIGALLPAAYGLWVLLTWQLQPAATGDQAFTQRKDFYTLYFFVIGGLVAATGVLFTWRRVAAAERTVAIAQEGQITERFTRAVAQLGDKELTIRLGGIYALERIARDSERDHGPIMEVLTAFVREHAPWKDATASAQGAAPGGAQGAPSDGARGGVSEATEHKPATDIQAVLTVLGRRPEERRLRQTQPLDLRNTDLRGADLQGAHLDSALLSDAHLDGAVLQDAHLDGAVLTGAHLDGALLSDAHLDGAVLTGAHLDGALLGGAHLDGAVLSDAHLDGAVLYGAHLDGALLWDAHLDGALLSDAHLDGAYLRGAHLDGALLSGAHLDGALLSDAHLDGADMTGATGLTPEQVSQANLDDNTKLPDYLPRDKVKAVQP